MVEHNLDVIGVIGSNPMPLTMPCYVYLIKSKLNGNFYVGITANPHKRLQEHNSGKLKSTSKNKPYSLIYTKEYPSYSLARKHEIWLKKKSKDYKNGLAESHT